MLLSRAKLMSWFPKQTTRLQSVELELKVNQRRAHYSQEANIQEN